MDKLKTGKNQDELEMDQLAHAELNRLQRQYRIMESDRIKFAEASAAVTSRGTNLIAGLQREHDELQQILGAAEQPAAKRREKEAARNLATMLDKHAQLKDKIAKERTEIHELDIQIARVGKSIEDINKSSKTEKQLIERDQAEEKSVKKLEDNLDCEIKKYNSVVADNARLREEISHLIRERANFNTAYSEIADRIANGKRKMSDLIEQSSSAYDQRDDLCRKLQALKARGQADLLLHTQEIRELQRRLDHDRKLQEYLEIKGRRRILRDLEAREAAKKQKLKEQAEQKIENYKRIIAQIMEFSKEKDMEKLGAQFIRQEEENFALFNYVNELNQEVELLTAIVNDLKKKIGEQHCINQQREQNQGQALTLLRQELEEKKTRNAEIEQKNININEKLHFLLKGIEEVFLIIRCDNAPILRLFGDASNISTDNITLFLALIEKKVNSMLKVDSEIAIDPVITQTNIVMKKTAHEKVTKKN